MQSPLLPLIATQQTHQAPQATHPLLRVRLQSSYFSNQSASATLASRLKNAENGRSLQVGPSINQDQGPSPLPVPSGTKRSNAIEIEGILMKSSHCPMWLNFLKIWMKLETKKGKWKLKLSPPLNDINLFPLWKSLPLNMKMTLLQEIPAVSLPWRRQMCLISSHEDGSLEQPRVGQSLGC